MPAKARVVAVGLIAIACGFAFCGPPIVPTGLTPDVLFDGGFETGDHAQWHELNWNLDRPESEQFQIVTSPVREGRYAAKTIVHDGDEFLHTGGERCDLERPGPNEREGDELWYSWSTYFPDGWWQPPPPPDDWLLIIDWHSTYDEVCQNLQLQVNGDFSMVATGVTGDVTGYDCFDGPGTAYYYDETILPNVAVDVWHDFKVHVKWTAFDAGVIEIWHKLETESGYTKVLDLHGIPTLQYKGDPNSPVSPYLILAHYRDASNTETSVLYHDAFRQTGYRRQRWAETP